MKRIIIDVIPSSAQRYPTCGDYFYGKKGVLHIKVSDTGDEYMNRLIALHEFIEEALTKKRGVAEADILAFDLQYERERAEGKHLPDQEPGNDPRAIYRREHFFAESMERMAAHELGVNWFEYSDKVNEL